MAAARGVTRDLAMSSPRISVPEATLDLLDQRTLQPNSPSCGNQPAHISLTARRPDTHATPGTGSAPDSPSVLPAAAQHAAVLTAVKGNCTLDGGCAPRHPGLSGSRQRNAHQERPTHEVEAFNKVALDKTVLHIS